MTFLLSFLQHLLRSFLNAAKEYWPAFVYVLVCVGASAAFLAYLRHKRNTRAPFCDLAGVQVKLTRQPGESLLQKWQSSTDETLAKLARTVSIPPVIAGGLWVVLISVAAQFGALEAVPYIHALAVLALLFATGLLAFDCARFALNAGNYYLGYFGERYVADLLCPLSTHGYFIFHDVPCPLGNIDHAVVGPAGVFVIETKTRRKKKHARDAHKVTFNGRSLVGPWGEDNRALEQAEKLAMWLADTIKSATGSRPFVTPIVTLPEWYIDTAGSRGTHSRLARVLPTKAIAPSISNAKRVLADETVGLIRTLLDQRCRNVTF